MTNSTARECYSTFTLKILKEGLNCQFSEPVLFPKLRTYLADFPYLRCPINQRLLTSET